MPTEADVASLTSQVLWAALALGIAFGAVAQRAHFCTMGAIADIVNVGDWTRARMWLMAMGVGIVGFHAMVGLGWIDASKTFYTAPRLIWLSNLVGGAFFGVGMVLASGCGSKTLVRVGGGNLKALVVFLVIGLSGYATMRGLTAVWRVNTLDEVGIDLESGQDLPSLLAPLLGVSSITVAPWLGLVMGGALVAWALWRREGRQAEVLLGGLGIGVLIAAAWWVTGRLGHVAEHPTRLGELFVGTLSGRMEGLTFVAPIGWTLDWLMFYSDANKVLSFGVVTVVGVILGAAMMALGTGAFRWETFASVEDTANHLVGGVLMGVGGVTAMGCTIGQGLTGMSTLSLGSFIALAGIVLGAVAALRYQSWRLDRMA